MPKYTRPVEPLPMGPYPFDSRADSILHRLKDRPGRSPTGNDDVKKLLTLVRDHPTEFAGYLERWLGETDAHRAERSRKYQADHHSDWDAIEPPTLTDPDPDPA